MTKIYQFKVKGYTTILYGKKCNIRNGFKKDSYYYGGYYVQRGDGEKYCYQNYLIEWAKEICEVTE